MKSISIEFLTRIIQINITSYRNTMETCRHLVPSIYKNRMARSDELENMINFLQDFESETPRPCDNNEHEYVCKFCQQDK